MQQLTNPRELRGLAILSQLDTIIQTGKNEWDVRSQSKDAYYQVSRKFVKGRNAPHLHDWFCTCPDFATRNAPCKHIHAVQFSLKLSGDIQERSTPTIIAETEVKILCPSCKSANVVKRGIRKTQFGEVQRYGCTDCNHRFVVDKGFCRMKFNPKVITLTLDLYFKGVSQRKIADHLKQFESIAVTQPTILTLDQEISETPWWILREIQSRSWQHLALRRDNDIHQKRRGEEILPVDLECHGCKDPVSPCLPSH